MPHKDFLAPKCCLKRRLTGYYCYLIFRKITKFVAKILRQNHQIQFRLGSLHRSPRPHSWILGCLLLTEERKGLGMGGERERKGRKGDENGRRGGEKREGGEGKERLSRWRPPVTKILNTPLILLLHYETLSFNIRDCDTLITFKTFLLEEAFAVL